MPTIPNVKEGFKSKDTTKERIMIIVWDMIYILVFFLIFTMSSWQMALIYATNKCMDPKEPCPYPANEKTKPYFSEYEKWENYGPVQAFLSIFLNTISGGLLSFSKGSQCCDNKPIVKKPVSTKKELNLPIKAHYVPTKPMTILMNGANWGPFDVHNDIIGWPYDGIVYSSVGFKYWLATSQIKAWAIPRQLVQTVFLFLAGLMSYPETVKNNDSEKGSLQYYMKFAITLFLPLILLTMVALSFIISLLATIWGGFFQHILEGNLPGLIWGFFLTWILVIYNMIIQPISLLASFFIIPSMTTISEDLTNPTNHSWFKVLSTRMDKGGYRTIGGWGFAAAVGTVLVWEIFINK